jgi:hypothetical protein
MHGATVKKKTLSTLRIVWLHKLAGSKETAWIKKKLV